VPRSLLIVASAFVVLDGLVAPPAAAARWVRPVRGEVTRGFALRPGRFAAGSHRGADFAAPRGSLVSAACAGRVVVADRIGSSGGVVTVACGRWRVSHLPLDRILARLGARVGAGEPVGTAGRVASHAGLHLGVRRAGDPDGYVDPLRFLDHAAPPLAGPPPLPAARELPRAPAPRAVPAAPRAAPAPRAVPAAPSAAPAGRPVAPWPVWAGLAVLLLAAAGGARLRIAGRLHGAYRRRRAAELRGST
jgi:Peptidase family M23